MIDNRCIQVNKIYYKLNWQPIWLGTNILYGRIKSFYIPLLYIYIIIGFLFQIGKICVSHFCEKKAWRVPGFRPHRRSRIWLGNQQPTAILRRSGIALPASRAQPACFLRRLSRLRASLTWSRAPGRLANHNRGLKLGLGGNGAASELREAARRTGHGGDRQGGDGGVQLRWWCSAQVHQTAAAVASVT